MLKLFEKELFDYLTVLIYKVCLQIIFVKTGFRMK